MDAHLATLLEWAAKGDPEDTYVWWGKLRSANRQQPLPHTADVLALHEQIEQEIETHLYLTDYRSLYVAHLDEVTPDDVMADSPHEQAHAPAYYRKLGAADFWFRLLDIRRLVLCGMEPTRAETPDGGDKPLAWLLHGTEQIADSFRYTAANGVSWTGTIHAPAAESLATQAARSLPRLEEIASASMPDGLCLHRLQALGPPTSQRRYSASSLMSIGKPAEPLRRTRTGSTGAPDARTTGNILHAVMQHLRDGDDLDAILDREIESKVGTDLPPEWRQALRTLIETARAHRRRSAHGPPTRTDHRLSCAPCGAAPPRGAGYVSPPVRNAAR
jgi:hypothetical protein